MDTIDYSSSSASSSSSSSSVLSFALATSSLVTPDNETLINQENNEQLQKTTKKLPSSKYKGVVPQANGRWGAQLYNGHKRVWLGTFDRQEQAATVHDLAAIRFRGVHAAVNFSAHHYVSKPHHLEFLASHSMVKVVTMLRTHTYQAELARFMRARALKKTEGNQDPDPAPRKRLFQKVLTASDVGKGTLHRLVIPKCHAERDLPTLTSDDKGLMLNVEDGCGDRVWRFKYCYWKGSKNYVFTKGWSLFVKEKGLKPGDTVSFYSSHTSDNHKRLYIESGSSLNFRSAPGGDGTGDVTNRTVTGSHRLRLFGVHIRIQGTN